MLDARVMKFGGTSVADAEAIRRLLAIVRAEYERGNAVPVVVVSAMAGVTDRLLALASAAARGERAAVASGVEELRGRHLAALDALVPGEPRARVALELNRHADEVAGILASISILRELSPRSLDRIASAGELLSSRLVAAALEAGGVPAVWIDARRTVVTDDTHGRAAPQFGPTCGTVRREIVPHVLERQVPVAGGFVGATAAGITTTLGRGGSDYSASIIGAALGAAGQPSISCAEIQIWTDVDGMLTADPRLVDSPAVVPHLSFGEASELAYFGAKVLHPSTILPAVERDIPVRILNSRSPEGRGTEIAANPPADPRPVAALACKRPVTVIEVTSTRMLMAHGFLRRLFEVFERYQTAVDVVTTSEVSVSVTVDDDRNVGPIAEALGEFAEVTVERGMALLCAVGDNLRADPRNAVRLLGSLEGLPMRMVSQAAARRNVTVVLPDQHLAAAMNRLHDVWFAPVTRVPAHAS